MQCTPELELEARRTERLARQAWDAAAEKRLAALTNGDSAAVVTKLYNEECAAYDRWTQAADRLQELFEAQK